MHTHDIKDLSKLPPKVLKVGSCRPGKDPRILSWEPGTIDVETFIDTVAMKYISTIEFNKQRITKTVEHIYGRALIFSEKDTTEVLISVKKLVFTAEKSSAEIANEFKKYLGYPCNFFRREGDRRVPVELARIERAYMIIRSRGLVKHIERVLYY